MPEATVICPECEQPFTPGEHAANHAKHHWLSNPNLGLSDLRGEARRRYEFLTKAKAGDSYEYPETDKRARRAASKEDEA